MRVLYDDVLKKPLGLSCADIGVKGEGDACFGDIDGWALRLPPLVFPFRRAMYYIARYNIDTAMRSRRSTIRTADLINPSDELWAKIQAVCEENSACGDSLFFLRHKMENISDPNRTSSTIDTDSNRNSNLSRSNQASSTHEEKLKSRAERFSMKRQLETDRSEDIPPQKK